MNTINMKEIEAKKREILAKEAYTAADLVTIVELLRAPGGCPWDREQTHKSIRKDFIEETYEVIEAIDAEDDHLLCEELGDVLLQVAMHAEMEREAGRFDFNTVADGVCRKLIHRHPHVFGEVTVSGSAEVLSNWEVIKSEEKSRVTVTDKLRAIPRQLPALMRAAKVGKKAKDMDFPDAAAAADKLREELAEVEAAAREGNEAHVREEMGDLILSTVSLSRFLGVEPEEALSRATDKFIDRYAASEALAAEKGVPLAEMTEEEREKLWKIAKKAENSRK